jgi:hypothetical protein
MTDDTPMGFGFGASNNLKCLSCANRYEWEEVFTFREKKS